MACGTTRAETMLVYVRLGWCAMGGPSDNRRDGLGEYPPGQSLGS